MTPATREWLDGLRGSVASPRPPAGDSAEPAAVAAERMILAAHLATWLDTTPALIEARRDFARTLRTADPESAIVITTSPAGLAVTEDMLGRDEPLARALRPRTVCATEPEYRAWCVKHPDDAHLLHVNHWNWIKTRVPPERDAEFAAHALRPGERYWLHRTGTSGTGSADGRASHLWKFTGLHAALLQPFVADGGTQPRGA